MTAVGFPLGGPLTQTRGKVVDRVAGVLGESGKVLGVSTAVTHGSSCGTCSATGHGSASPSRAPSRRGGRSDRGHPVAAAGELPVLAGGGREPAGELGP